MLKLRSRRVAGFAAAVALAWLASGTPGLAAQADPAGGGQGGRLNSGTANQGAYYDDLAPTRSPNIIPSPGGGGGGKGLPPLPAVKPSPLPGLIPSPFGGGGGQGWPSLPKASPRPLPSIFPVPRRP